MKLFIRCTNGPGEGIFPNSGFEHKKLMEFMLFIIIAQYTAQRRPENAFFQEIEPYSPVQCRPFPFRWHRKLRLL